MSFAAAFYVLLVGILLPVLCVRSYFKLKAGARFPPKSAFHKQTLIMLGFFFLLAWFVWRSFGLPVFPPYPIRIKDVAAAAGVLLVLVCAMYPWWKFKATHDREQVYRRLPQASSEMGWWIAVSFAAGFSEEIVYRGVLFGILVYRIENWWIAAVLCALAFALAHAIQGWKGALIVFAVALVFQGLVRFTGTLYIAMAVHASYDIIAGFAYLHLYKKTTPEAVGATAASVM
jgi:membrane protease YdiL (CAAX protease family)